jgi:uncharacterized protein YecE (DUF72 family)
MKFGKLTDPLSLAAVDFSLPPTPERTLVLLRSEKRPPFRAYVGCPMWGNKAWAGKLYPPKAKPAQYLQHYARSFHGIELNSTHYQIPKAETVERWREMTDPRFRFSPKIPQLISHRYQLFNCEDGVESFVEAIEGFEDRLGCSFVQLPPHFGLDKLSRLDWFLALWPRHLPLAIEFRHESWFQNQQLRPEALDLLEATGTATVITDVAGRRDVVHANLTQGTAMIRFVGNGLIPSDYQRADAWINRIEDWVENGIESLYFFVHEPDDTYAPEMGRYVVEKLNERLGLDLAVPGLKPDPGSQMSLF